MGSELTKAGVGDYSVDPAKVLGEGGFGKVYIAHHKRTKEKVAIKQCQLQSDDHGAVALSEIKHFQSITPHKHIVKMKDFYFQMKSFWIVMEFCDIGDLESYMKRYMPPIDRQVKIMHQCASAVQHLHNLDNPIIHRDIKPGNILFKRESGSDVAKLTDFGISKQAELGALNRTVAGTQLFMPPEMLAMQGYDATVDTYALGLVYLAMIIYKPSDENMIPISESAIRSNKLIPLGVEMLQAQMHGGPAPKVVASDPRDNPQLKAAKKLITSMTSFKPADRKSMKDVLSELEAIDGGRIEGVRGKSASRKSLFTSNLPAQATVLGSSGFASSQGAGARLGMHHFDRTIKEEDDDVMSDPESGDDDDVTSTGSSSADPGYMLLREMVEDHLREKKEEELQEEAARAAAKAAAGLLPLLALLHLAETEDSPAKEFEIGDKVVMLKDLMKVKELQDGHGGWMDDMEKYLDEEGVVKERVNGNRDVRVMFADGKTLVLNAQVVAKSDPSGGRKASNLAAANCKFNLKDCVIMNVEEGKLRKLQKGHGGFNHKMTKCMGVKGVVHLILDKGDVYVEFFNGDKWCVNPEALDLVDMSGVRIEAGDLVAIIEDKRKAMDLQENFGGWNTDMAPCLGRVGIVRRVGANHRAIVEVGDSRWTWNVKALKLLAKSEEMAKIILQRSAEDED